MKRELKRLVLAVFAAIVSVSCGPKVETPDEPVFPDPVEKYIAEGEPVTVEFNANMDWTLRIEGADAAYFYLMDSGIQVPQLSGTSGAQAVTVYEKAAGTSSRTCTLSLTVGEQTKDIATIHTEPAELELSVYAGAVNERGGFTIVGGGEYEYESVEAVNLHVIWPDDAASYILPVKVSSNFGWSISSVPEWLDPSKAQSEGDDTFLLLRTKADKLPLEDASGKIAFMNPRTKKVIAEYGVSIDGCKNMVRYSVPGSHVYLNVVGQYYSGKRLVKDGCPLVMSATSDSDIVAFELRDGILSFTDAYNCWLNVARTMASGSDVIRDITYRVTASRNNGGERSIVLLGIPAAIRKGIDPARDILTPDGSAVKEEYNRFVMTTVTQQGFDEGAGYGVVCPLNTPYQMAVLGADFLRTPASDPSYASLSSKYSCTEIYTANLNNWDSAGNLLLNISVGFDSVVFFSNGSEHETDDSISLDYPQEDDHSSFKFNIDSFNEGYETALVFKSKGSAVAVIVIRMSESYWPEVEYNDIHFVGLDTATEDTAGDLLPVGASLTELTEGELYDSYKSYKGVHVWKLSYDSVESIRNAMFYVPPFPALAVGAISIDEQDKVWLGAEPSISENDRIYLTVSMNDKAPERGSTGVIVLYGGGRPLFVLQCERRFLK